MKARDFLFLLPDLVRQQLPAALKQFQVAGPTMSLVKLHYGSPPVHYEAWVQRKKGELELGLHFEDNPAINSYYLDSLLSHVEVIRSSLGRGVQLERWAGTWARVHETVPLEPLTDDFLVDVSVKLSRMIHVLEPLIRSVPRP